MQEAYAVGNPISDLKSGFFRLIKTRRLSKKEILESLGSDKDSLKIFLDKNSAILYAKSLRKYTHYPKNGLEKSQVAGVFTVEVKIPTSLPYKKIVNVKDNSTRAIIPKVVNYHLVSQTNVKILQVEFPDSGLACYDFRDKQKSCTIC